MIPALINTAASLASSIYSGISIKNNQAATNAAFDKQQQKTRDQFNVGYYQDLMQTDQMQSVLSTLRNRANERTQAAANTATIMGSTPEAIAATKKGEAQAYSESINQLAANGFAQKQQALSNYQNRDASLAMNRLNSDANYMNMQTQNTAQAINNFGNNLSSFWSKK